MIYKRIAVSLLAALMMLAVLAGCQTKASIVKRGDNSSRGIEFHSKF